MTKKSIERLFVVAMCIVAIDHDAMAQKSIEELVKSNVIATQIVQSSCDVRHASYESLGFPGGAPISWV